MSSSSSSSDSDSSSSSILLSSFSSSELPAPASSSDSSPGSSFISVSSIGEGIFPSMKAFAASCEKVVAVLSPFFFCKKEQLSMPSSSVFLIFSCEHFFFNEAVEER